MSTEFEDSMFRKLIKSGATYIDKTELIAQLLHDHPSLRGWSISRPIGFGKSLNLDMIREFIRIDRNRSESVFTTGMTIMKDQYGSIRDEYMNGYPVIFFSFKSIAKCSTFQEAKSELHQVMRRLFSEFKYLLDSDIISVAHKNIIRGVLERSNLDKSDFLALRELCTMLKRHHNRFPFLIIDDVDGPIMGAILGGYVDQMRRLMYNILCEVLKGPTWSVITASELPIQDILPVGNDIRPTSFSIYDDFLATYFGFTDSEVKMLVKKSGKENDVNLMHSLTQWYSHFNVGNERIYNPASILKCYEANWDIKTYATASRSISKLTQHLITDVGLLPVLNFQVLLTYGSLKKQVWPQAPVFKNILTSESFLLNYFLHVGIVVKDVQPGESWESLTIRMKGTDIQNMLRKDVIEPLVKGKKIPDYTQFTEYVQKEDAKEVVKIVEKYLLNGGVYLFSEGENVVKVRVIADYVKLIMAQWTTKYGGRETTDEKANQMVLRFFEKEGREKMRVRILEGPEKTELLKRMKKGLDLGPEPKISIGVTFSEKSWKERRLEIEEVTD